MFRPAKPILIVINTLRLIGGAETQALLLAKTLKEKHGRDVRFLSFEEGDSFRRQVEDAGMVVETIPLHFFSGKWEKLRALYDVVRYIRKEKIKVLIPFVAVPNKIVGKIWRLTGAEFAFWNQRDEGRNLTGHPSEKRWINSVSAVVSNSFEGRDFLARTYGIPTQKISVIPNGVVLPTKLPESSVRERIGLPQVSPLVTMVANIHGYKDHKTLVEAWRLVMDRLPTENPPVLVFAGEMGGPTRELKALAFELGLCETLCFAGHVDEVNALIAESALGVFSSNLEGCPNGVLEFMAHGRAVVGTDISGVRQALGERYADACLVPPHRSDLFADNIVRLLTDDALRKEIEMANRERIKNEFSVESMAQGYVDLIDGR